MKMEIVKIIGKLSALIIFFMFCIACTYDNTKQNNKSEEYKIEIDNKLDKVIKTTKIERNGHTYIIFHNMKDSFGVVHDPDCCY